jgi:hypothetical protein
MAWIILFLALSIFFYKNISLWEESNMLIPYIRWADLALYSHLSLPGTITSCWLIFHLETVSCNSFHIYCPFDVVVQACVTMVGWESVRYASPKSCGFLMPLSTGLSNWTGTTSSIPFVHTFSVDPKILTLTSNVL